MSVVDSSGFHVMMKSGCPGYCLPHSRMVSRDVHVVFRWVKERLGEMLQVCYFASYHARTITNQFLKEYDRCLSFATDAWTSPNHRAFVALTVHFEDKGTQVSLLLDIVELAKSHTGLNLAKAFAKVVKDYGIDHKVSICRELNMDPVTHQINRSWV